MIESASEIFETYDEESHQIFNTSKYLTMNENLCVDEYPLQESNVDGSENSDRKYELLSQNFVNKMEDEYWGRSEFNDRITNLIRECSESTVKNFHEYCHNNFISKNEFESYGKLINSADVRCSILEEKDKEILQNQSKIRSSIQKVESAINAIEKKIIKLQETQSILQLVNGLTTSLTENDQTSNSGKNRHISQRRNSSNAKMSVDHELSVLHYDIQSVKRDVDMLQTSTKEIRTIIPQLLYDMSSSTRNDDNNEEGNSYFHTPHFFQPVTTSLSAIQSSRNNESRNNNEGKLGNQNTFSERLGSTATSANNNNNNNNNININKSDNYNAMSESYQKPIAATVEGHDQAIADNSHNLNYSTSVQRTDQHEERLPNNYSQSKEDNLEVSSETSQSNYFKHYGEDDRYVLSDNLLDYGGYFQEEDQEEEEEEEEDPKGIKKTEEQRSKSVSSSLPYRGIGYHNNDDSQEDIPHTTTTTIANRNKANRPSTSVPSGRHGGNTSYRNRRIQSSANTSSRPTVNLREPITAWGFKDDDNGDINAKENHIIQHKDLLQKFLHDDHYFSSKIKESIEADEQEYYLIHGTLTHNDRGGGGGGAIAYAAPTIADSRIERHTAATYVNDTAWEWNLKFGTTATASQVVGESNPPPSHTGMRGNRVRSGGRIGGSTGRTMFALPSASSQQLMMDRYRRKKAQTLREKEKYQQKAAVVVTHPPPSGSDSRTSTAGIPLKAFPGNYEYVRRPNDATNDPVIFTKTNDTVAISAATTSPRSNLKGSPGNSLNKDNGSESRHHAHLTAVEEVMKHLNLTAHIPAIISSIGNQTSPYSLPDYNLMDPVDRVMLGGGEIETTGGGVSSDIKNGRVRQKSAAPREASQKERTYSTKYSGEVANKSPRPPTAPSRMQRGGNKLQ